MVYGLAAILARVDDYAEAIGEALVRSNLRCNTQEVTEKRTTFFIDLCQRIEVLARHDQYVNRRLRMNIGKGITAVVLIDRNGWNASIYDLTEKATYWLIPRQHCNLAGVLKIAGHSLFFFLLQTKGPRCPVYFRYLVSRCLILTQNAHFALDTDASIQCSKPRRRRGLPRRHRLTPPARANTTASPGGRIHSPCSNAAQA
jgi:hypothetical protein